jgi:hypothetical protein
MNTQTIAIPLVVREEIEHHMKAQPRATWSLLYTKTPDKDIYNFPDDGIRISVRWTLFVTPERVDSDVTVVTFCEWEPLEDATYTHTNFVGIFVAKRTSTISMTRQNARVSWTLEVDEGGNNITSQIEPLTLN